MWQSPRVCDKKEHHNCARWSPRKLLLKIGTPRWYKIYSPGVRKFDPDPPCYRRGQRSSVTLTKKPILNVCKIIIMCMHQAASSCSYHTQGLISQTQQVTAVASKGHQHMLIEHIVLHVLEINVLDCMNCSIMQDFSWCYIADVVVGSETCCAGR